MNFFGLLYFFACSLPLLSVISDNCFTIYILIIYRTLESPDSQSITTFRHTDDDDDTDMMNMAACSSSQTIPSSLSSSMALGFDGEDDELMCLKKIERVWDSLNRSFDLLQKVLASLDRGYLMNSDIGSLR